MGSFRVTVPARTSFFKVHVQRKYAQKVVLSLKSFSYFFTYRNGTLQCINKVGPIGYLISGRVLQFPKRRCSAALSNYSATTVICEVKVLTEVVIDEVLTRRNWLHERERAFLKLTNYLT